MMIFEAIISFLLYWTTYRRGILYKNAPSDTGYYNNIHVYLISWFIPPLWFIHFLFYFIAWSVPTRHWSMPSSWSCTPWQAVCHHSRVPAPLAMSLRVRTAICQVSKDDRFVRIADDMLYILGIN